MKMYGVRDGNSKPLDRNHAGCGTCAEGWIGERCDVANLTVVFDSSSVRRSSVSNHAIAWI
eukprot:SAG31_NODE_21160_length_556_cov_1.177243_1_plen_61_part_00